MSPDGRPAAAPRRLDGDAPGASAGARVLVLGLDGATFDVLQPLMARGAMPTLAGLVARGCAAPLRSIIPPTTAPAWMSFQTGTNPGKHGIVDFTTFDPERRTAWLATARDASRSPFWVLLSRAGRRVAVVNVPLVYPSAQVDGVIVPGIFAPPASAYPPETLAELAPHIGAYLPPLLAGAYHTLGPQRFVVELGRRAHLRADAAAALLERERWDFFMVNFQSVDSLQHMLWTDLQNALAGAPDRTGALAYFAALDENLGRVAAAAAADYVFVVSDHGFGPLDRLVYVNEWLRREGWLTLRASRVTVRLAAGLERLTRSLDVFKIRRRLKVEQRERFAAFRRFNRDLLINLERSRAYALYCSHAAHVYLNRALGNGAEYERTRGDLIASLERFADPETGRPIFPHVYRREDVFHGEATPRLPDVVALPQPGLHITTRLDGTRLVGRVRGPLCGDHRPEGVFIAAGGDIAGPRRLSDASILDVAPTVLYLLDVPVPADMDGRVLTELFDPAFVSAHPVRTADGAHPGETPRGDADFSAEEMDAIQTHLRGLGYL